MSTPTPIGVELATLRRARGLSIRQLSRDAGVAYGTIAGLESGAIAAPAMGTAQKLAAFFGLTVSALTGEDAASVQPVAPSGGGETLASVDYTLIDRSDLNPRRHFDPESIATLADSVAEHGFIQPIMLRPRDDAPGRYWIVVGERRWRAAGLLHEQRDRYGRGDDPVCIPARIRSMTDREHLEIALIENMHRTDVAPLDEAKAIAKLVDDYAGDTAAAAHAIGKTGKSGQRFVQIALNLVQKLTPEVQAALADGTINKEMARQLTVANPERQAHLLLSIQMGEISNGKQLRQRMQWGNFPATKALFGRLKYNGPVVEDPDSDAVIFTDLGLVKSLQIEAMQERATNHREAYPHHEIKVIVDDALWHPDSHRANQEGFYRKGKLAKVPHDAVPAMVLVLNSDLSVSIYDDLIKLPPAPTTAAEKKQAAKAAGDVLADFPSGAKMHARRCRTMALQRALFAERSWRTLLAHLCLNLLGGNLDHTPMLAVRAEHRSPDVRAIDPDVADVINEFRENLEFQTGTKLFTSPTDKDPNLAVLLESDGGIVGTKQRTAPIVLDALYDLEDADLLELAMALLAARAGTWYGNGLNGMPDIGDQAETLAACGRLGLTHAVADDAGGIDWPAYLDKLNGPALDVVRAQVDMPPVYNGMAGARWSEAAQKEKRAGLSAWLNDRPDKAAYIPAIFRFGDGKDIDAAMREEANAVRPAAQAAE